MKATTEATCCLVFLAGEDAVLCPVCHACALVQRHGWLVCPSEGWQLNFAAESLHLGDVKARLAAAYQVHPAVVIFQTPACYMYHKHFDILFRSILAVGVHSVFCQKARLSSLLTVRQHALARCHGSFVM